MSRTLVLNWLIIFDQTYYSPYTHSHMHPPPPSHPPLFPKKNIEWNNQWKLKTKKTNIQILPCFLRNFKQTVLFVLLIQFGFVSHKPYLPTLYLSLFVNVCIGPQFDVHVLAGNEEGRFTLSTTKLQNHSKDTAKNISTMLVNGENITLCTDSSTKTDNLPLMNTSPKHFNGVSVKQLYLALKNPIDHERTKEYTLYMSVIDRGNMESAQITVKVSIYLTGVFKPFSTSSTKWSDTLKQFVGKSRRIFWVCLTILWGWHLKG